MMSSLDVLKGASFQQAASVLPVSGCRSFLSRIMIEHEKLCC